MSYISKINQIYHWYNRKEGPVKVIEEDWDNLIILDACRYDLFKNNSNITGKLNMRYSSGSHTLEFLKNNFGGEFHGEIVYISATPQIALSDCEIYYIDPVWEEAWDYKLHTVPPEAVKDQALKAHSRFPNKRLVIHFLQPHYPFIGETGKKIPHRTLSGGGLIDDSTGESASIWDLLKNGKLDQQTVWKAYRENLEIVESYVQETVEKLDGKSVVTSDHGNSFGEWDYPIPRKVYGHPTNVHIDCLLEVPWLVIPWNERRSVVEENKPHQENITSTDEDVLSRLQDLGYK